MPKTQEQAEGRKVTMSKTYSGPYQTSKMELNKILHVYSRSIRPKLFLKLVSIIFYQFLFLHQMIALWKLWKMLFISSKKLFSFLRYSNFCISLFLSFSPCQPCFKRWSKINLKIYDIINCLNKNLITDFVWYHLKEKSYDIETLSIDRVLNKQHFYEKVMQEICTKR